MLMISTVLLIKHVICFDMAISIQVRRRLRSAVMKSNNSEDDFLVRAVAQAFFDSKYGLQACEKGYLMPPVSYSVIAWYIRQETDLELEDDFDNWYASDAEDVAVVEQEYRGLVYPHEEMDMPDLTCLLVADPDCEQYFKVLRSPYSNRQIPIQSQPCVIADLSALIKGRQLQKIKDLLPQVRYLTVHPEDPAYLTELNRLTTMQVQSP